MAPWLGHARDMGHLAKGEETENRPRGEGPTIRAGDGGA
jgi:hypothetical protein